MPRRKKNKKIHELELHEKTALKDFIVYRVTSGWIYYPRHNESLGTFVPDINAIVDSVLEAKHKYFTKG